MASVFGLRINALTSIGAAAIIAVCQLIVLRGMSAIRRPVAKMVNALYLRWQRLLRR